MAIFKDAGAGHSDRSSWDRKRHRQLVEDAIKKNIGDIVADESIIGQSKDKKIKVPVKGIKEYQFVYGNNSGGTGAGSGQEQRGQVVGKAGGEEQGKGAGQAGSEPGEEIYETEITMEELVNYLFEDLNLPDMEKKKFSVVESERKCRRSGYQRKGIPPHLDKRRSMIEKLKRRQSVQRAETDAPEDSERVPFREDDLRYRRIKEDVKRNSNAAVICIMDVSGSMDQTRKYLARSFFFLLYQFVRWRYEQVEVAFIAHTTEAKEVDEDHFFHHGEDGGTYISSGYAKALEVIEQRYNPAIWNIYAFHCSDGDNWGNDNEKAVELAGELCDKCNLFGYGEITTVYSYGSTIRRDFERNLSRENFVIASISRKEDVWPAFRKILEKDKSAGGEQV